MIRIYCIPIAILAAITSFQKVHANEQTVDNLPVVENTGELYQFQQKTLTAHYS